MINIHELTNNEAERLKAIRLRALQEDPDAFGTTYEEAILWDRENWTFQAKNIPTFIASTGEEDVGMVRVTIDADNVKVAWLISMWVSPSARGQKLGQRLIDAVIRWAKLRAVGVLKLDVGDDNKAAIALYESKGFKPNGTVDSLPEPRALISEHQRELKIL